MVYHGFPPWKKFLVLSETLGGHLHVLPTPTLKKELNAFQNSYKK